jgi:hypothetical protein
MLPPLHRPSNTWKALGCVGVFLKGSRRLFEGEDGGDRGGKNLLLPLFRASRGRRRPTVPFKTTLFGSFFFNEQCLKRCRFKQNALFHLKRKGGKNVSEFTLVLNL